MVVQSKAGTRYLCNYLRQQYHVPVCHYMPADPVDAKVVAAFFAALAPIELDVYQRALAAQQQTAAASARARVQQLQRLRYQAALAQRQFEHVDPANRLVAAELERRWETALRDLQQAEAALQQSARTRVAAELPADLRDAFSRLGQKLPDLWSTGVLSRAQKQALLRCLLDKVVIQRVGRDRVHIRLVWRGGEVTECEIPIVVHALTALSSGQELERRIVALHTAGTSAAAIAQELTAAGFRSPKGLVVLPSTVQIVRLKQRLFITRHHSHPRRVSGFLTVPQLTRTLGVPSHWLYDGINKGRIHLQKDPLTGLYLFPDHPSTLDRLTHLRDGQLQHVGF